MLADAERERKERGFEAEGRLLGATSDSAGGRRRIENRYLSLGKYGRHDFLESEARPPQYGTEGHAVKRAQGPTFEPSQILAGSPPRDEGLGGGYFRRRDDGARSPPFVELRLVAASLGFARSITSSARNLAMRRISLTGTGCVSGKRMVPLLTS